jgi:hypothetical protein
MLRILLCMLCLLLPYTAYTQSLVDRSDPLAKNLALWWIAAPHQMGGTTWYPQVGRDRGTLAGMTLAGTTSGWQSSTRNRAYGEMRFDGSDDQVNTGTTTLVANLPAFTICVWFRSTSTNPQQLYSEGVGSWPEMTIALNWSGSTGGYNIRFFNWEASVGLDVIGYPATPVESGVWQHLCAVQESKSSGKLYSNTWMSSTSTGSLGTVTPTQRVLGASTQATNRLVGALDDIRVYNRALSPNEVKQVYVSRPPLSQPSPSFMAAVAAIQIPNKGLLPFFTTPR